MSASPERSSNSILQLGVLALLAVGAWFFIKFYFGEDGFRQANIPRDIQVNYKPAGFTPNVDESEALRILSNPQSYPQEFDALVHDVNTQLMSHVVTRMGLTPDLQTACMKEYERHHPYLKNLYFNDFISLKDTSSNLYQTWYADEAATSVDLLNEIASKYTCFFVNQILTTVLKTDNGRLGVKGKQVATPCGVALTEALRPMIARLQEKARVEDFSRSKGLMQERVTSAISELATIEVRDKKGINKQLQTKIWGVEVSNTQIEISAISIVKIGFKLDKKFELNLKGNTLVATLPAPQILSHEVYPKVDKLNVGWMRELESEDFNKNINVLREYFREDVRKSDAFEQSKLRASELMQTMLGPALSQLRNVKLVVRFSDEQAKQAAAVPLLN